MPSRDGHLPEQCHAALPFLANFSRRQSEVIDRLNQGDPCPGCSLVAMAGSTGGGMGNRAFLLVLVSATPLAD